MPEIGQIVGEKYRLERVLGEGGMGSVFEAVHIHIGSKVAIKFLHPGFSENWEAVQRFQREAQAAAAIGHDAIVHVHDIGVTDDGSQYLVMESLRGRSLAEKLTDGPISVPMAAYVVCQVLSGLHAAHEQGIVHRDMKPDNIFLVETGAMLPGVKILDFGISRVTGFGNTEDVARLTRTGIVLGTPAYMSPEHARGRADVDSRSDIFSMGIILYECLTGMLPFEGDNYNAILAEIIIEEPAPPTVHNPDIPPRLETVILNALKKDRANRYQSAWEMFDDLIPFVEESAVGRIPIPAGLESVPTRRHDGIPPTAPVGASPANSVEVEAPTISELELDRTRDTDYERDTTKPQTISRSLLLAIVAAAAVVLIAGTAVGWAMLGGRGNEVAEQAPDSAVDPPVKAVPVEPADTGPSVEAQAKADAAEPRSKAVVIDLKGIPDGAQIFLDGTKVRMGDLPLRLAKGGPLVRLRIVHEGHETLQRWLNPNRDQTIEVNLTPLPEEQEEPPVENDQAQGTREPVSKVRTTKVRVTHTPPPPPPPTKTPYRPPFID